MGSGIINVLKYPDQDHGHKELLRVSISCFPGLRNSSTVASYSSIAGDPVAYVHTYISAGDPVSSIEIERSVSTPVVDEEIAGRKRGRKSVCDHRRLTY